MIIQSSNKVIVAELLIWSYWAIRTTWGSVVPIDDDDRIRGQHECLRRSIGRIGLGRRQPHHQLLRRLPGLRRLVDVDVLDREAEAQRLAREILSSHAGSREAGEILHVGEGDPVAIVTLCRRRLDAVMDALKPDAN